MWPYFPHLLNRPVPRYTSYPTAAEFRADVGAADLAAALDGLPAGALVSLYVHIPFCRDICWYCGCNTERANSRRRLETYLAALEREIDAVAARVSGRVRVGRIAFGGGSPNAISPIAFVRLVDRLLTAFSAANAEISVELDPRGLDASWAAVLGKLGVTRASLGVQTLDSGIQQRIGRVQPAESIAQSVALLRGAGVRSLNFDLIYGLPGQTMAALEDSVQAAIAMRPDRVALFGYAHVPDRIARQRRLEAAALPGQQARFDMAQQGHQALLAAGYMAIGFDHFALPEDALAVAMRAGRLRRNFQGFTDDNADALIGLGASSISLFDHLIVQNERASGLYRARLEAGGLAAMQGVRRDAEDRERGLVIGDILCGRPADLTGLPFDGLESRLKPFTDAGLAVLAADRLRLTADALPYARAIAACFDRYRTGAMAGFSAPV